MEEEVKAIRTIKEFVVWYENIGYIANNQFVLTQDEARYLYDLYIKFKYILEQEPQK